MAKWSTNITFEESDEVAVKRIETVERLTNRLLDLASVALPVIAQQASRKASTPRRSEADTVVHAQECACRVCRRSRTATAEVEREIEALRARIAPKGDPGLAPGTPEKSGEEPG